MVTEALLVALGIYGMPESGKRPWDSEMFSKLAGGGHISCQPQLLFMLRTIDMCQSSNYWLIFFYNKYLNNLSQNQLKLL